MTAFFSGRILTSEGVKGGGEDIMDSCWTWWMMVMEVSYKGFFSCHFFCSLSTNYSIPLLYGRCVRFVNVIRESGRGHSCILFFYFFPFLLSTYHHPPLHPLTLESHLASYILGEKKLWSNPFLRVFLTSGCLFVCSRPPPLFSSPDRSSDSNMIFSPGEGKQSLNWLWWCFSPLRFFFLTLYLGGGREWVF